PGAGAALQLRDRAADEHLLHGAPAGLRVPAEPAGSERRGVLGLLRSVVLRRRWGRAPGPVEAGPGASFFPAPITGGGGRGLGPCSFPFWRLYLSLDIFVYKARGMLRRQRPRGSGRGPGDDENSNAELSGR